MQKLTNKSASPVPFINVDRSNALWTSQMPCGQKGTLENMGNILKSEEIFLKGSDVKIRKK